jgi:hypothetical protein
VDLEKVFSLLVHILKEALIVQSSSKATAAFSFLYCVFFATFRLREDPTGTRGSAALDEDLDYYDIDDRDLEAEFPADETSEDEYCEDDMFKGLLVVVNIRQDVSTVIVAHPV